MADDSTADQSTTELADKAAESADSAIQSARRKTNDALDGLSSTMQNVKDQASATLERLRPGLDSVTSYAKDEPTKALLIAAATGAALVGLIALMGRSGDSDRMPSARSLRRTAEDAADGWRKAAADRSDDLREAASRKADKWHKAAADGSAAASSRTDDAIGSAKDAYQAAYDGLSETMQDWKNQASSLADRVRPQLETVTGYAKDDPAKALLIAAAAGAALVGLMSAMKR